MKRAPILTPWPCVVFGFTALARWQLGTSANEAFVDTHQRCVSPARPFSAASSSRSGHYRVLTAPTLPSLDPTARSTSSYAADVSGPCRPLEDEVLPAYQLRSGAW